MSQITLKSVLWRDLVAAAKRKQRRPETLAAKAIRDYLQRMDDEDLLERSTREARKNGPDVRTAEDMVKQRRQRNGR